MDDTAAALGEAPVGIVDTVRLAEKVDYSGQDWDAVDAPDRHGQRDVHGGVFYRRQGPAEHGLGESAEQGAAA